MFDASYISRRAFLKALGLGTASVTAAAALPAAVLQLPARLLLPHPAAQPPLLPALRRRN